MEMTDDLTEEINAIVTQVPAYSLKSRTASTGGSLEINYEAFETALK